MSQSRPQLHVCSLYPDRLNIYGDRGNLMVLANRCARRGIGFSLVAADVGDPIDPRGHDLFYMGGGQDREQRVSGLDLVECKRDALCAAAAEGAVVLGVCGGSARGSRSSSIVAARSRQLWGRRRPATWWSSWGVAR
jgi:CobQ-like glutamine amidotransferase family enzyme